MLKAHLRFQLWSQQDVTKTKSPSGSFAFLTHPLQPRPNPAKKNPKINHVLFIWALSSSSVPWVREHRAQHKGHMTDWGSSSFQLSLLGKVMAVPSLLFATGLEQENKLCNNPAKPDIILNPFPKTIWCWKRTLWKKTIFI